MKRALIVGDVHAKVDDLVDCEALINVIVAAAEFEKPDVIIFLGDLYDAFAVKNVVVERWWMEALWRLEERCPVYLVVGNHDRPGDSTALGHALQAHVRPGVRVADTPLLCKELGDVVLLPFYFKAEEFVSVANVEKVRDAKTVFCHQSFIGGKYESGQPIEARHDASAVDATVLPQRCIIAGHIHTPQTVGKVWYPGSPRWRNNVSDANIDRFVYAVDFENGLPRSIRPHATGQVCRRIWQLNVTPDKSMPVVSRDDTKDRYVVDITGPAEFIEKQKKLWAGPNFRIRTFQTDRPGPKLSEAQGLPAAWKQWEGEYQPKHGTPLATLQQMVRERLSL